MPLALRERDGDGGRHQREPAGAAAGDVALALAAVVQLEDGGELGLVVGRGEVRRPYGQGERRPPTPDRTPDRTPDAVAPPQSYLGEQVRHGRPPLQRQHRGGEVQLVAHDLGEPPARRAEGAIHVELEISQKDLSEKNYNKRGCDERECCPNSWRRRTRPHAQARSDVPYLRARSERAPSGVTLSQST